VICTALHARAAPLPRTLGLPPRAAASWSPSTAGDLTDNDAGLAVFIQTSKTEQEGLGDLVGIAHGHPAGPSSGASGATPLAGAAGCPPDFSAFRPITRLERLGTRPTPTRTRQSPADGNTRTAPLQRQHDVAARNGRRTPEPT
jgi:hypothetical protein